jgi:hypothetical protein
MKLFEVGDITNYDDSFIYKLEDQEIYYLDRDYYEIVKRFDMSNGDEELVSDFFRE